MNVRKWIIMNMKMDKRSRNYIYELIRSLNDVEEQASK